MNYRHAFHAGNHADVLKHVVLLALLESLKRKDGALFVLDTHAGRGHYLLAAAESERTGEAREGIFRLFDLAAPPPAVERYLRAVQADNPVGSLVAYPGSPLLAARALRAQDRLAACELQAEEADALRGLFAHDPRVAVHQRDGYAAVRALLPPRVDNARIGRGVVLIDPPYEAQQEEYPKVLAALAEALQRWPTAACAAWYPIKQRRTLQPFLRKAAALPARGAWLAELQVRPDDSPLRLAGSGMLLLNPPWQLDAEVAAALPALRQALAGAGGATRLEWLRRES
ncbi:MAG: 23S rRNA (adenine(2030)-N(6))-methyltransferase RlmJ [Pseudoxanthomonas sp.]